VCGSGSIFRLAPFSDCRQRRKKKRKKKATNGKVSSPCALQKEPRRFPSASPPSLTNQPVSQLGVRSQPAFHPPARRAYSKPTYRHPTYTPTHLWGKPSPSPHAFRYVTLLRLCSAFYGAGPILLLSFYLPSTFQLLYPVPPPPTSASVLRLRIRNDEVLHHFKCPLSFCCSLSSTFLNHSSERCDLRIHRTWKDGDANGPEPSDEIA
jgi:hypothetical protein